MAFVEESGTVCKLGFSTKMYELGFKEIRTRANRSLDGLWFDIFSYWRLILHEERQCVFEKVFVFIVSHGLLFRLAFI